MKIAIIFFASLVVMFVVYVIVFSSGEFEKCTRERIADTINIGDQCE